MKYRFSRIQENFLIWISNQLPRKICYWAFIRVFVYATTGEYGSTEVPSLTCVDAMKRWQGTA